MLSPAEDKINAKKQVTEHTKDTPSHKQDEKTDLQLLLHEFKSLKETVDYWVTRLEVAITKQEEKFTEELHKLEDAILKNRSEVVTEIKNKVEKNTLDMQYIMNKNKYLHKENSSLKDRMSRLEAAQLCNNVIITGIPEQQWEPYEATKQQVIDTIAASLRNNNDTEREGNKIKA